MKLGKLWIAAAAFAILLGGAVAVASLGGEPSGMKVFEVAPQQTRTVAPEQLSEWIISGKRDFAVVDMRDRAAFEAGHVRGAVSCGSCHASKEEGRQAMQGAGFVDLGKKLVLVTARGDESVMVPKLIRENPFLYMLEGGQAAWDQEIMAEVAFADTDSEALRQDKLERATVRDFYLGKLSASSRPAPVVAAPVRQVRPHRAQIANEGC